ncbi:hypothetical protein BDV59DRAFT_183686, partial [Aspergillus ambiguus]|uniref:uncharacterized protein n=1 Tax=Aspergillus ambiguus TaxID=176160 RepID=UPI003CCDBCA8
MTVSSDVLSSILPVKPGVLTKLEKMLMAGDIEECHQTLDDEISKYAHPELCVSRALIIAL